MSLVHGVSCGSKRGDLCDDPSPRRVGRIGVHTQMLGLFLMCERDLMSESMLAGFEGVQFDLTPAKNCKADTRDGTLVRLSAIA